MAKLVKMEPSQLMAMDPQMRDALLKTAQAGLVTTPTVTLITTDDNSDEAVDATLKTAAPPGSDIASSSVLPQPGLTPSDDVSSLASSEAREARVAAAAAEVSCEKVVWMYEVPNGPWACYDDLVSETLEKARDGGERTAIVPCLGKLYKVHVAEDGENASNPNASCNYCGNQGHKQRDCPQQRRDNGQPPKVSGMHQVPHGGGGGGDDGEEALRVRRAVIDNWPEDAWQV